MVAEGGPVRITRGRVSIDQEAALQPGLLHRPSFSTSPDGTTVKYRFSDDDIVPGVPRSGFTDSSNGLKSYFSRIRTPTLDEALVATRRYNELVTTPATPDGTLSLELKSSGVVGVWLTAVTRESVKTGRVDEIMEELKTAVAESLRPPSE